MNPQPQRHQVPATTAPSPTHNPTPLQHRDFCGLRGRQLLASQIDQRTPLKFQRSAAAKFGRAIYQELPGRLQTPRLPPRRGSVERRRTSFAVTEAGTDSRPVHPTAIVRRPHWDALKRRSVCTKFECGTPLTYQAYCQVVFPCLSRMLFVGLTLLKRKL